MQQELGGANILVNNAGVMLTAPFASDQREEPLCERHGARSHRILRLADDPQDYIVIIEFASFGGAQGFAGDPLLLPAIDAAGIEGGAHHVQDVEEFREQLEAVDYTW